MFRSLFPLLSSQFGRPRIPFSYKGNYYVYSHSFNKNKGNQSNIVYKYSIILKALISTLRTHPLAEILAYDIHIEYIEYESNIINNTEGKK